MGEAAGQVTGWEDRPRGETPDETMDDQVANDPQVEALVSDIDETRAEMSTTVEEIGDRLDPRNIVADAKQTVRDATVGKVEDMANTATEMIGSAGQTAQEAGGGLVETIRRNPVPAALAGIGLGWLAISARNQASSQAWSGDRWSGQTGSRDWPDRGTWDQARQGEGGIGQQVGDRVGQVGQAAGDAMSTVQHTAQDAIARVGDTASEVPYQAQNFARDVTNNASRMFNDNPLAVGAIALAVGAAVGMALPPTRKEREVLGSVRDDLIDKAESTASQALGDMEQQAQQQAQPQV